MPPPPGPSAAPTTYLAVVAHFLDFLTVAVHTLLHHRALYPPESFVAARKYNCPVRQSRHRGVCDWVNAAVDAVEGQLLRCAVRRVALVVFAPRTGEPLERFVFDLARFPQVAPQDRHVPFAPRDGEEEGGGGGRRLRRAAANERARAAMDEEAEDGGERVRCGPATWPSSCAARCRPSPSCRAGSRPCPRAARSTSPSSCGMTRSRRWSTRSRGCRWRRRCSATDRMTAKAAIGDVRRAARTSAAC